MPLFFVICMDSSIFVCPGDMLGSIKTSKFEEQCMKVLGWPRSSFGLFHNILRKNLNEVFGQSIS